MGYNELCDKDQNYDECMDFSEFETEEDKRNKALRKKEEEEKERAKAEKKRLQEERQRKYEEEMELKRLEEEEREKVRLIQMSSSFFRFTGRRFCRV